MDAATQAGEGIFEGTASQHNLDQALHAAIAAAKNGLGTDLIHWKLLEMTGEDGGFALVTDLTVKIHAKVGPKPTC